MNLDKNVNFPSKIVLSNKFNVNDSEWSHIFTFAFMCTIDNNLRDFQYKVIHNMLWFNKILFKIGIVETSLCSFCNQIDENRIHIFGECEIVVNFLEKFQRWWYNVTNKRILLNPKIILLGYKPEECKNNQCVNLFNLLLLIAKNHIYKSRSNKSLDFESFIGKIKHYKKIEKIYWMQKNNILKFLDKWEIINWKN